jgi:glycosyltransferase involved in cell wall biosynthesis
VIPSLVTGGAERGCVDVARGIVEAGGVAVVASEGGPMTGELERAGAIPVTLPVATKNPLRLRANIARLAAVIEDFDVALVHARSRAPAWSARAAARRAGLPFVTTFHSVYRHGNPLKTAWNAPMAGADRVIVASHYVARHVAEVYGTDAGRIRVIPRGIDLARFAPEAVTPSRVVQLATRWRVPEDRPILLLPARLTERKGHLPLFEALARLGRPEVFCLVVGADQGRERFRETLEQAVVRLGLESQVRFCGHCDDLPAALRLADAVVVPSQRPEAFGRTLAEASAMGLPVVTTAIGAAPEIVVEGETGWLVPPGDIDALAGALDTALSLDADARRALADRARTAVAGLTREAMVAETLAVYEELLGPVFSDAATAP